MGIGAVVQVERSSPSAKLAPVEEEKISSIVEICNVSGEEALRVLHACHMDKTMAIDRLLCCNEVSNWCQVSKKKKPVPRTRSAPSTRNGHVFLRNQDRDYDHDHDKDRHDRARFSQQNPSNSSSYRRGIRHRGRVGQEGLRDPDLGQKPTDSSPLSPSKQIIAANKPSDENTSASVESSSQAWGSPVRDESCLSKNSGNQHARTEAPVETPANWSNSKHKSPLPNASDNLWGDSMKPGPRNEAWATEESSAAVLVPSAKCDVFDPKQSAPPSTVKEAAPNLVGVSSSSVARSFNYAEVVTAGTGRTSTSLPLSSIPISQSTRSTPAPAACGRASVSNEKPENASALDTLDLKRQKGQSGRELQAPAGKDRPHDMRTDDALSKLAGSKDEGLQSIISGPPTASNVICLESAGQSLCAWGSHSEEAGKTGHCRLDETPSLAVASAVVGAESNPEDSLSLQFGSLGLNGLSNVNWSSADNNLEQALTMKRELKTVSSSTLSSSTPAITPASISIRSVDIPPMPVQSSDDTCTASNSTSAETQSQLSSTLPSTSVGSSSSGIFPVLPLAPGGNFPPLNYCLPPLHPYTPTLGSYEGTADFSGPRAPTMVPPGSLALPYGASAMPQMPPGNRKYAGIPGLGERGSSPGVSHGMGKDGLSVNSEMENNSNLSSSGLAAGMDLLSTPYIVSGYASMQYPQICPFPSAAYPAPPGMGPPGANHFPYPSSSHGPFGYDDGLMAVTGHAQTAGLDESVYSPGGYLGPSSTASGSQKTTSDVSYKQVRGSAHLSNTLGTVEMASGIVHGITFAECNTPGGDRGASTNGVGPEGWNYRQANAGPADGGNGTVVSNPATGSASLSPAMYATAPTVAHSGYLPPQQVRYYP